MTIHRERRYEIGLAILPHGDGSAEAELWVRLRSGEGHPIHRFPWPGGAPTPKQLELLEATLLAELHVLVLGTVGVQGVIFPQWEVTPFSD